MVLYIVRRVRYTLRSRGFARPRRIRNKLTCPSKGGLRGIQLFVCTRSCSRSWIDVRKVAYRTNQENIRGKSLDHVRPNQIATKHDTGFQAWLETWREDWRKRNKEIGTHSAKNQVRPKWTRQFWYTNYTSRTLTFYSSHNYSQQRRVRCVCVTDIV